MSRPGASLDGSGAGRLLAAVFAASSDAVVVVDAHGSIVLSSAAVTSLFGYEPEELVGEHIEVLVPGALRDAHVTHRKAFVEASEPRQMGTGLQLYGLTRGGREVPIDVSLTPAEVNGRRYVAAFVRDATDRKRNVRQLEDVIEVTRQLLAGASIEETVGLTLLRARELVDAASAWLVTTGAGGELSISAASGLGEDGLRGTSLPPETSRAAGSLRSGEVDVVPNLASTANVPAVVRALELGPAVYVPLGGGVEAIGVLVVARRRGEPPFEQRDVNIVRMFSAAAAVALALGGTRHELERLQLIEEDERIARDLHDTIVQRAFAVGMSLESVRRLAAGPVLERIDAAVQGLDEMIRDLRNAIFHLSHPLEAGTLQAQIAALADELAGQLGFPPRLALRGLVDERIRGELADELVQVCREALSNVVRHARATEVDVTVLIEDGHAVLAVTDDGIGIGDVPKAGSGLVNMAARAERLGGTFVIARAEPFGTAITWRVPLAP